MVVSIHVHAGTWVLQKKVACALSPWSISLALWIFSRCTTFGSKMPENFNKASLKCLEHFTFIFWMVILGKVLKICFMANMKVISIWFCDRKQKLCLKWVVGYVVVHCEPLLWFRWLCLMLSLFKIFLFSLLYLLVSFMILCLKYKSSFILTVKIKNSQPDYYHSNMKLYWAQDFFIMSVSYWKENTK